MPPPSPFPFSPPSPPPAIIGAARRGDRRPSHGTVRTARAWCSSLTPLFPHPSQRVQAQRLGISQKTDTTPPCPPPPFLFFFFLCSFPFRRPNDGTRENFIDVSPPDRFLPSRPCRRATDEDYDQQGGVVPLRRGFSPPFPPKERKDRNEITYGASRFFSLPFFLPPPSSLISPSFRGGRGVGGFPAQGVFSSLFPSFSLSPGFIGIQPEVSHAFSDVLPPFFFLPPSHR